MPPKKEGPSKKNVDKAKTKMVEDKTFGMKNKNKSKKVQEYVKQVTTQVKGNEDQKKFEEKLKKKEQEEKLKFEKELFKPAAETKVPVGVSPKSILCELFKIGMCTKGDKCKYSHNLAVTRKSEKIDIYTDKRDQENDTIDKWDTEKLETVIGSKEGQQANKTDIVCKYFIEAIEKKVYGWFWTCPNGGDQCKYRHALPPGFVLKSQLKKEDLEEDDGETLEDQLEAERAKLVKRTPLTKELFLKWKEDKKKEKEAKAESDKAQREKDIKQGRAHRSGREIFVANPDLFTDDLDADVFDIADLPEEESDVPIIEIDVSGTSIRTRVTGGKEEEGEDEEGIQEDLFVDDDIPDVSDEEDS